MSSSSSYPLPDGLTPNVPFTSSSVLNPLATTPKAPSISAFVPLPSEDTPVAFGATPPASFRPRFLSLTAEITRALVLPSPTDNAAPIPTDADDSSAIEL